MGGTTQSSGTNRCEDKDEADLDIKVYSHGNCNSHCIFKPGKKNAITVELIIENNEISAYYFDVDLSFKTQHTDILSDHLPNCDLVEANDIETFYVEVWQDGGPKYALETLEFDVRATTHSGYCNDDEDHDELSLNVDIAPQLCFG